MIILILKIIFEIVKSKDGAKALKHRKAILNPFAKANGNNKFDQHFIAGKMTSNHEDFSPM